MRILIVEDDRGTSRFIEKGFVELGITVDTAYDGADGQLLALTQDYDLIILDVSLPEMDGFTLLKLVRKQGIVTPVIFLTARSDQADIINGLDLGADDYLVKPFTFAELSARVRAILRRGQGTQQDDLVTVENLTLNRRTREVERDGHPIELSATEFKLLNYLMSSHGQVLTRTMILEQVWGYSFDTNSNVIDVHINRLRAKLDKDYSPKLIHTVVGVGYVLKSKG